MKVTNDWVFIKQTNSSGLRGVWMWDIHDLKVDGLKKEFKVHTVIGSDNHGLYTAKRFSIRNEDWEITTNQPIVIYTPCEPEIANIIKTKYYMGNDFKDVLRYISPNTFEVDDKWLPYKHEATDTHRASDGKNEILEYTGLERTAIGTVIELYGNNHSFYRVKKIYD